MTKIGFIGYGEAAKAIVSGDALLAKQLTKAHIANAKDHMLQNLRG